MIPYEVLGQLAIAASEVIQYFGNHPVDVKIARRNAPIILPAVALLGATVACSTGGGGDRAQRIQSCISAIPAVRSDMAQGQIDKINERTADCYNIP
jgi:hypothetical protein